jgi:hypothetical protein
MENMEKIPLLTPYRVGQFDRDADYGVREFDGCVYEGQ